MDFFFFLHKRIALLQKAFINPPEPCGVHVYDGWMWMEALSSAHTHWSRSLPL